MSEVNYYVYTHSTEKHGIFYVGKGTEKRIKTISRKNKHHTRIVNKYGKENIIVRSMLCCSEKHALELEIRMIASLRNGGVKIVNMTDGGEGTSGCMLSDETRAKMSEAQKGKLHSDEHKSKLSESAKNMSNETKLKIGAASKGRVHSDESKLKMSTAHKNMSDETKLKISESKKGGILSDEHKAKISESLKGKFHSDETKVKMSIAAKNRKPKVSVDTDTR